MLAVTVAVLLTGCAAAQPVGGTAVAAGPAATVEADPNRPDAPHRVRIPSIDVESDLVPLGLRTDGSLQVPRDYAMAGWYTPGPRPGESGPTVLVGHVDSTSGPAVFYRLRDLRPGDTVDVSTAVGEVARYVVRRTEQHPKDRFPTFAVYGATSGDTLRLVTCAGEFDRGERSYTDNLVVYAARHP